MNATDVGATTARDNVTLFHLAEIAEWQSAQASGAYVPLAFAAESFIHTAHRDQVEGVYGRYYAGRTDLVVLEIDRAAVVDVVGAERVIEELSPSTGDVFPHIYAPLPVVAVRAVHDIEEFRQR